VIDIATNAIQEGYTCKFIETNEEKYRNEFLRAHT